MKIDTTGSTADETHTEAQRWVETFALGWRAPADASALTGHFRPWLHPEFRFRQPLLRGTATGVDAFHRRLARPLFGVLGRPRGRVLGWAARDGIVFIELVLEGTVGRRPVQLHVTDRFVLEDGRPVERQSFFDPLPLMLALLRAPSRWPAAARLLLTEAFADRTGSA